MKDITDITGLTDTELDKLIPYAQAQARSMLGFLEEQSEQFELFLPETTNKIILPVKPITDISNLSYTLTSGETPTDITNYRVLKTQGYIFLDAVLPTGAIVTGTYTRGWNKDNVPDLVKLLLVVLVVNLYYSMHPNLVSAATRDVISEKIGDYTIKYASGSKSSSKKRSWDDWADYLVSLILNGPDVPEVTA